MKRLGSSDSLGALMSMCPAVTDDHQSPRNNTLYSRDYQSIFDEDPPLNDETTHISEKKRRLSIHQVKALEKNFEVENKLEPERKVKLATELGLQPRQVAVWFQNRRARWKTKQLERDYSVLKANYDTLKSNYQSLQQNNDSLIKEIKELKSKLNYEESTDQSNATIKEEEEAILSDQSEDPPNNNHLILQPITPSPPPTINNPSSLLLTAPSRRRSNDPDLISLMKAPQTTSSDSNSSAILNEDNSPNSSFLSNHHQLLLSSSPTSFRFNSNNHHNHSSFVASTNNCIRFMDQELKGDEQMLGGLQKELVGSENNYQQQEQQQQLVKLEEHDFFSGEEACNFFNDEQAPSLHWYCPDQWA